MLPYLCCQPHLESFLQGFLPLVKQLSVSPVSFMLIYFGKTMQLKQPPSLKRPSVVVGSIGAVLIRCSPFVLCSLIFFLDICSISSPTRLKSRGTLLSYIGGIVTLPCPVTTRSSVPDSTARATSPGYLSPPPHQLWCQRDGKAKLVPESQVPPRSKISHCQLQSVTSPHSCTPPDIPPPQLLTVANDIHKIHLSLRLSRGMLWIFNVQLSYCNGAFHCQMFVLHDLCAVYSLNMQNSMSLFLLRKATNRHTNITGYTAKDNNNLY